MPKGQAIEEQLANLGYQPEVFDFVVHIHLNVLQLFCPVSLSTFFHHLYSELTYISK
ncbi:hypothetical protein [Viridibacillus arvi]|uniref:hypothetical protein n=1 Tax=Viridibacillus arvi TaxID=263475 RepID=UPI003D287143